MRLIKMFGFAAFAAVAAMAFVGATSASATSTQLCSKHIGESLKCEGAAVTSVHTVLAASSIWKLLATIDVLCLGFLIEASAGALENPQEVNVSTQTFSGCGTGSTHTNCTVSTPVQPSFGLLKSGLDEGTLTAGNGQIRVQCPNIGLNCLYDLASMEFAVGGGHLTADETRVEELDGLFLCPDVALVDALLKALGDVYVLG